MNPFWTDANVFGAGLLATMLLCACATPTPNPEADSTAAVSLEQQRVISITENDSLFIGDFRKIGLQENPFRMYVPDYKLHQIVVLDSTGRILQAFGSHGRGPGELHLPMNVAPAGSLLYVQENNRFSVFDQQGRFKKVFPQPENTYDEGEWDLTFHNGQFYFPALKTSDWSGTLRASPSDQPISTLNDSMQVVDFFGSFPSFYQKSTYMWRWRSIDISGNGLLAVGYYLLPNVYLYDVSGPKKTFVRELDFSATNYHQIDRELPAGVASGEWKEVALNISATDSPWLVGDSLVVLSFHNKKTGYYEKEGGEAYTQNYAIVASTTGEQYGELELPGTVLGSDSRGRLYIQLSDVPDERKIGVYEIRLGKNS
jgi:hypothetical protein